jgi:hypothetical protein
MYVISFVWICVSVGFEFRHVILIQLIIELRFIDKKRLQLILLARIAINQLKL